jgi:hypothetical protein
MKLSIELTDTELRLLGAAGILQNVPPEEMFKILVKREIELLADDFHEYYNPDEEG